jgi:hypothetical protein
MTNVLPPEAGVEVNSIFYQYTAVKDPDDDMVVNVQNKHLTQDGYIFRETDDWSQLPGQTITKYIALPNIPKSVWGDGEIEVEGQGSVQNPTVIYNYKVDPCFDPQLNPACDGYIPNIPNVDEQYIYDPLNDDNVSDTLNSKDTEYYEEQEETESKEESDEDREMRLEKALSIANNSALFADALAQSQILQAMNNTILMNQYYGAVIQGGVYQETNSLADTKLPENKTGLRNGLAQQILHEKMVNSQYNKGEQ